MKEIKSLLLINLILIVLVTIVAGVLVFSLVIIPPAIKDIIDQQEAGPVANPPAVLYRCQYQGSTVYYLPPRCCDIPSQLYDAKGEVICSPDGGLTAYGDGRCKDFSQDTCKAIWKDKR